MNKKTSFCAIAISVALCISMLTGCGNAAPSSEGMGQTSSEAESVLQDGIELEQTSKNAEYMPLTGLVWKEGLSHNQRPVAVMMGNTESALPQCGITSADVIYEMVTEGGITRLMAVYSDPAAIAKAGSVRSTRDQFVQFMLPINAIGVHIGSSIYGTEMLRQYQYATVNGIYLGTLAFSFDENRNQTKSNVHCWFTDANGIAQGVAQAGIDGNGGTVNQLFSFLKPDETPRVPPKIDAQNISYRFSGVTDASFTYDAETGSYLKSQYGGVPQMDEATGIQYGADNVFLLAAPVTLKPDGSCTEFDFTKGEGWYFSRGGGEKIKWQKGNPTDMLKLYSEDGQELSVNCGTSYVAFVDAATLEESLQITGTQPTETGESVESAV